MADIKYFILTTFTVKPSKLKHFHEYLKEHKTARGAEFIAAFNVIAGREGTNAVMCLYRLEDVSAWFSGKVNEYLSEEMCEYCEKIEYTLMDMLDYSRMDEYLKTCEGITDESSTLYNWADIELVNTRVNDYHDNWKNVSIKNHSDIGSEMVATFNIISGVEDTTHVKRLFKVYDIKNWADGEVGFHTRSNKWADTAINVHTTEMYPLPFSRLK